MDSYSDEGVLNDLNTEEVKRLAPLILFLLLVVIVGIPGNIFVCIVYRKSSKQSNSKMFILWLAVVDLISCFVVTLEIVNVLQQYTFSSEWLCKIIIFTEVWPIMTSGALLCIISIDRYRKVCHPLGWQISNRVAKIAFLTAIFLSLMCAWPALILFGLKEVRTHAANMTGTECGILPEYHETVSSKLYNGTLWIIFVLSLSLLTILYSFITKKLIQQRDKNNQRNNFRATKVNDYQDELTDTESVSTSSAFQPSSLSVKSVTSMAPSLGKSLSKSRSMSICKRKSAVQSRSVKSAYIMCLISVVFVLSFLPYLILRLLEAIDNTFVDSMSDTGRATYKSFLRCYFLNCAINPIIYCVCSTYFRRDLMKVLRGVCK